MAACPLCGTEIRAGARFCRVCGTQVAPQTIGAPARMPEPPREQGAALKTMFVLVRCNSTGRPFVVNLREAGGGVWEFSAGPILTEQQVGRNAALVADLTGIRGFRNAGFRCPLCDATGLVRCSKCGKTSCWNQGRETDVGCGWCHTPGPVGHRPITTLKASSDL